MIDTKKMHASISKIRHIFGGDVRATQSLGEVFELITRLREAEKDAARYRWLRDVGRHECDVDDFFGGSSDSVDGMIDKAMNEKGDG